MASVRETRLQMYGGIRGGLVPLIVLVVVLFGLSVGGTGGVRAFWTAGWLALTVGLFFAREKTAYCLTIMRGLGDKNGIVIVTSWLFAGVFGKLMVAGGLIDGMLWAGLELGASGKLFALVSFLIAMVFSMGTGTSTGTVLSLVPVLYPAGVFLGADPTILAVGILSGAAFGDNLAPISDTTIVSAYTQEARMQDVVRSRFPLALSAALISMSVIWLFGAGNDSRGLPDINPQLDPVGLLMLLSFVVVIVSSLAGKHLVESLIYGNIAALGVGLLTGRIAAADVLRIPETTSESTGLIQDGIGSVIGAIVFALLMLATTQVLVDSGVLDRVLKSTERLFAKSLRRVEFSIVLVTILASIPIASNAAAELLVGPGLVKSLGERFGLSAARRANLMDCSVCTVFYMMPWAIVVVVWYGAVETAADVFNIPAVPFGASFLNPYSWAMLGVLLFSVITGWNRKFASAC